MELIALWHIFKRRWWLMALPALVALVVTLPQLPGVVNPSVTYLVQMRLTAAAPPDAELAGITTPYEDTVYVPLLASEYVVINMPGWITSDTFADEVGALLAEQGMLDVAQDDLRGAFAADGFRSILTLYVYWDDVGEIQTIAQAAITVLQTRNQIYFPQFAAVPVDVVPLDAIEVAEVAPPITARLGPFIRIFVGLAAGVGLAVLAEYLDDRLYGRADVESLGLPVLAAVPKDRGLR